MLVHTAVTSACSHCCWRQDTTHKHETKATFRIQSITLQANAMHDSRKCTQQLKFNNNVWIN